MALLAALSARYNPYFPCLGFTARCSCPAVAGTLLFDAKYGTRTPPTGPVWLQGLACDGSEASLMACTYDAVLDPGCSDPYWAAAVMCGGGCDEGWRPCKWAGRGHVGWRHQVGWLGFSCSDQVRTRQPGWVLPASQAAWARSPTCALHPPWPQSTTALCGWPTALAARAGWR